MEYLRGTYFWAVFIKHAVGVYSVIALLIGFGAGYFLKLDVEQYINITKFVAVVAFMVGSYLAWKEAIEQIPAKADLVIECNSVSFSSDGMMYGVPNRGRFTMELHGRNQGAEQAFFKSLEVTKFDMHNTVFKDKPHLGGLVIKGHGQVANQSFGAPTIDGGQHVPNLQCSIYVELEGLNPHPREFASRLGELNTYEIELTYTFVGMDGNDNIRPIPISGTFEDFKQECLSYWTRSGDMLEKELAALALEAMKHTSS